LSQVSDIEDDLKKYWKSYKGNTQFWDHEWTKHGTCCSDVSQLSSVPDFFKTTLGLRQQHDIATTLSNKGITPSDSKTYSYQEIASALSSLGKGNAPLLGCTRSGGVQYIHEISFCLSKTLEDIKCDHSLSQDMRSEVSDCDSSEGIVLAPPKGGERSVIV